MAYTPTESLDVTWHARNRSWRNISTARRDIVIDLPVRYRHLSIDMLEGKAGERVQKWCGRWGAYPYTGLPVDFDADDYRGKGLLIRGPVGTGKTTMACIAAQYVSDLGWSTKFVRAQDYYALSIQVMKIKDDDERERMQSAIDCYEAGWRGWKLVVLDDLGKEHNTGSGWDRNIFENLLRARYTDGAPTIITTNLSPKAMEERYGESFADYTREAFETVTVAGESRRGG